MIINKNQCSKIINKFTSLQILTALLTEGQIEYTTKECLLAQMPFKCDRATFKRHMINLLDSGLLVCEHYENHKVLKIATEERKKPKKEVENKKIAVIEKNTYAEYDGHTVKLKTKEYETLINEFDEEFTKALIQKLLYYKASKNKSYKSDYMAIRQWVIEEVKKDTPSNTLKLNYKDQAQVNFIQAIEAIS